MPTMLALFDTLLGSMLWSQFSAIFDNFRQKIGVFLKNQCYDQNFAQFTLVLSQKRQFFAIFFGENIFKIITSVPERTQGLGAHRRC
jgi:hypothetical protein